MNKFLNNVICIAVVVFVSQFLLPIVAQTPTSPPMPASDKSQVVTTTQAFMDNAYKCQLELVDITAKYARLKAPVTTAKADESLKVKGLMQQLKDQKKAYRAEIDRLRDYIKAMEKGLQDYIKSMEKKVQSPDQP
jgi:predicted  nucleic acid-binding Zn-ribbon protein